MAVFKSEKQSKGEVEGRGGSSDWRKVPRKCSMCGHQKEEEELTRQGTRAVSGRGDGESRDLVVGTGHKLSYVKPRGGRKPELASISSWVLSVLPGSGSSLQLILSGPAFVSKDSDLPKSWPLRDRGSSVLEHVTSNTRPGFHPQHRGQKERAFKGPFLPTSPYRVLPGCRPCQGPPTCLLSL